MTSPWGIDVSVASEPQYVEAMLKKLVAAIDTTMPRFFGTTVNPFIRERARARFMSEGDSATGPWAALSPVTQHIRATEGYNPAHPINRRTNHLENYIARSAMMVGGTAAGWIYQQPGAPATGKLEERVRAAQVGVKGKQPARPVLAIDEIDVAFILTRLGQHIYEVANRLRQT